jgi:hypothetical protein
MSRRSLPTLNRASVSCTLPVNDPTSLRAICRSSGSACISQPSPSADRSGSVLM